MDYAHASLLPGSYPQLIREADLDEFRVKLAAIETPRAAVALEGELGRGQSGVVTRGTLPGAGKRGPRRPVAIKQAAMPGRFNASHEERSTIDTALMVEGLLLLGLQHPWVVRVVGIVTDSTPCMVCTELMPHGDLKTFLRGCRPSPLTPPTAVVGELEMHQMASRLASAMAFLENRGVIHRDIAVSPWAAIAAH